MAPPWTATLLLLSFTNKPTIPNIIEVNTLFNQHWEILLSRIWLACSVRILTASQLICLQRDTISPFLVCLWGILSSLASTVCGQDLNYNSWSFLQEHSNDIILITSSSKEIHLMHSLRTYIHKRVHKMTCTIAPHTVQVLPIFIKFLKVIYLKAISPLTLPRNRIHSVEISLMCVRPFRILELAYSSFRNCTLAHLGCHRFVHLDLCKKRVYCPERL